MNQALLISNIFLWLVVLGLVLVVWALARQIGVLYERVAPMGALMIDQGPKVGEKAPSFMLKAINGAAVSIGTQLGRGQLLFFLSPTCPVCKKLLPVIRSIAASERTWLDIVLASDGDPEEHKQFYVKADLGIVPYVLSTELGMTYQISKLPYAVLIDEHGLIRAKGLVNSREQLESLFVAKETGVASIQEFINQRA